MLPVYCQAIKFHLKGMPFAWIKSALTWEAELADSVACTAEEDDPGNCRCPCVSGRPLNQVILAHCVFADICLGLFWSAHRNSPSKLRCCASVGGLSCSSHRVTKHLPATDLWTQKLLKPRLARAFVCSTLNSYVITLSHASWGFAKGPNRIHVLQKIKNIKKLES